MTPEQEIAEYRKCEDAIEAFIKWGNFHQKELDAVTQVSSVALGMMYARAAVGSPKIVDCINDVSSAMYGAVMYGYYIARTRLVEILLEEGFEYPNMTK
jgi:hypothetical protein